MRAHRRDKTVKHYVDQNQVECGKVHVTVLVGDGLGAEQFVVLEDDACNGERRGDETVLHHGGFEEGEKLCLGRAILSAAVRQGELFLVFSAKAALWAFSPSAM